MRWAFAAAAALALGGCALDFEGARCDAPGSTAECPSGQACGNDLRCSERAAQCVAAKTFCLANASPAQKRCSAAPAAIETCTSADVVCGAWVVAAPQDACAANLVCSTTSGSPACVCATPVSELAVDPASSSSALTPTGAMQPPECRFKKLGDALAAAGRAVSANPTATPVVRAVGGASGTTVGFGAAATGETFPLTVPRQTTLASDSTTSGAAYEIVLDDGAAAAAIALSSRATLSHFSIRNVLGDATARAVMLACDPASPDPVTLDSISIHGDGGAHKLGYGLLVGTTDTCGIVANAVSISGATVSGLHVDAASGAVASTFTGGTVTSCGKGIYLRKGSLKVNGTRVAQNTGFGIRAGESTGDSALELTDAIVTSNGDTGVAVLNNRRLIVLGTIVWGNLATTGWTNGVTTRRAGGVVLWGNPPSSATDFQFLGNKIYANKGDQVLGLASGSWTWNIDGAGCGVDSVTGRMQSNLFACYDTQSATPSYRGLVALDANVLARFESWANGVPTLVNDFAVIGTTGSVDATGPSPGTSYCPAAVVTCSTPP